MLPILTEKLLKTRAQDYVLCAGILAASVLWLAFPAGAGGGDPSAAVVRHGGEVLEVLPLDRPARRVLALEGGSMTVEVEPGKGVRISESSCPAKVCVHHGWARKTAETIVCLPNKLLVEIEGGESEYDAVIR